ncbi:MAG: HD domain-containing protein [Treponema sp.]|nr:HD domain-containing protein [Treponema sp.]
MNIHPILKEIASLFDARGRQVYLVGGMVRDLFLGKKAQDWDLATDAAPEEVGIIFRESKTRGRVIPTGIKHGTVTVHYKSHSFEVTTFRTETGYSDGRRPDRVSYAASIEEDLARRDFTMNAIALRLPGGEITDPFGGAADIKRRLIRCVGNPFERFSEDGLRPLRAVRFAAQLGFDLDEITLEAIPLSLWVSALVSAERIRDELDKILAAEIPSRAFRPMEDTGLLKLILPELAVCRGLEQKGFHRFDVLDHSLLACDYAARERFSREVKLAALLHDLGKVPAVKFDAGGIPTFYRHEAESARLARGILTRLRYPNAFVDSVCHLISEHMFHYEENWSDAAVRRFIVRAGPECLEDLYRLRRADSYASAAREPPEDFLLPLAERVDRIFAERNALSLKSLAVSGRDLIAAGVKPGKTLGIILRELLETVLEDPELNTREKLLEIAGNINKRYL